MPAAGLWLPAVVWPPTSLHSGTLLYAGCTHRGGQRSAPPDRPVDEPARHRRQVIQMRQFTDAHGVRSVAARSVPIYASDDVSPRHTKGGRIGAA